MTAPRPKKKLTLFDLICIGVNAIVGSGIYAFPGQLTQLLGSASFLAFAACGVMSLIVGLCFAEAASGTTRSGGPYVYAREAFGSNIGYAVGFSCWVAALLSWAAVANALVPYLGHLLPALAKGWSGTTAVVTLTLLLGAINYFGVKPGAYITDFLTLAKLVPLVMLTVAGFIGYDSALVAQTTPFDWSALPQAAFLAFFAYQGFEVVPVPAGESNNPRRNAPLAVIGSVVGATLLYIAVQIAAVGSTPDLAGSKEPLALMGAAVLGALGSKIVAAAAVVSMLGFCAGVALTGPRYVEALALDGFLPSWVSRRHARYDTPGGAIIFTTAITAVLIAVLDFRRLVDLAVFIVALQYVSTAVAVLVRRYRRGADGDGWQMPGGPAIPLLSIVVVLVFVGWPAAKSADIRHLIALGVLIGLGLLPALWKRFGEA
jgi:basic amino acid/polyamine antiporter, APA family